MDLAKAFASVERSTLRNVLSRRIHHSPAPILSQVLTRRHHFPTQAMALLGHALPGGELRLSDNVVCDPNSVTLLSSTTFVRGWGAIREREPSCSRQNENLPDGLCNILDTHLPSPWTCNWPQWRTWDKRCTLDGFTEELRHWYGIFGALNPIMFQSSWFCPTVLESRGTFYLFEKGLRDPDVLYKFRGTYISVEDFLENCDWNEMVRMWRAKSSNLQVVPDIVSPEQLPLTHSERGLRLASAEPYCKRTLVDVTKPKGVWMFESRKDWLTRRTLPAPAHSVTWPQIPDEQLPEPFSCAWHAFPPTDDWYELYSSWEDWQSGTQLELLRCWGVPDLTPVMFMAESQNDCQFYIPTVLRSGKTYYFWIWVEDPPGWPPILGRFEGTYANVEDFVENADWNRMYQMEPGEDWANEEEEREGW
ncbi:hypothetical protein B0H16DRAFT_1889833 [Mycena metata]|uniref:Uncharacterized protein n=1 Tax=Mycena metata TaxID=1033252 RepID=A0AAD7III2_9AGAR|nr:hypothetical protein B0H16DRAFT_1889833 [Mycena metata]